jgi:hypothetical protein
MRVASGYFWLLAGNIWLAAAVVIAGSYLVALVWALLCFVVAGWQFFGDDNQPPR